MENSQPPRNGSPCKMYSISTSPWLALLALALSLGGEAEPSDRPHSPLLPKELRSFGLLLIFLVDFSSGSGPGDARAPSFAERLKLLYSVWTLSTPAGVGAIRPLTFPGRPTPGTCTFISRRVASTSSWSISWHFLAPGQAAPKASRQTKAVLTSSEAVRAADSTVAKRAQSKMMTAALNSA